MKIISLKNLLFLMNGFLLFKINIVQAMNVSQTIQYLPGTEDIPLMKGLDIINDNIILDTVDGRILNVESQSTLKIKDIEMFYDESLKNLGWRKISSTTIMNPKNLEFERDHELLTLTFSKIRSKDKKRLLLTQIIFEMEPKGV